LTPPTAETTTWFEQPVRIRDNGYIIAEAPPPNGDFRATLIRILGYDYRIADDLATSSREFADEYRSIANSVAAASFETITETS
jgi:hypothetical protein